MSENNNYEDTNNSKSSEDHQTPKTFGFKANIRTNLFTTIYPNKFLDSLRIKQKIPIMNAFLLILFLALIFFGAVFFFINNLMPAKFIGFWVFLLLIGISILAIQIAFINPTSGIVLIGSIGLLKLLFKRLAIKIGKKPKNSRTGIHDIKNSNINGYRGSIIEFSNGDYGILLDVQGRKSPTDYPSETIRQLDVSQKYHTGRNRTTTEVVVSTSQRQNTDAQLEYYKTRIKSTDDEAKIEIYIEDYIYLSEQVNGVSPTIEQHLLLRDSTERNLLEHFERLENFSNSNRYLYSMTILSKKDTEQVLDGVLTFKKSFYKPY